MKEIKHKSLSLNESLDIRNALGKKVLTKDGKNIGKIRTIRIDPNDLTIEGIEVESCPSGSEQRRNDRIRLHPKRGAAFRTLDHKLQKQRHYTHGHLYLRHPQILFLHIGEEACFIACRFRNRFFLLRNASRVRGRTGMEKRPSSYHIVQLGTELDPPA